MKTHFHSMKIPLQNSHLQFAIGDRISQIFIHCLLFIRLINFDETGNLMKISSITDQIYTIKFEFEFITCRR